MGGTFAIAPGGKPYSGTKTTTAGVAVPLSTTSKKIISVTIQAKSANTGSVKVGGSASQDYILAKGDVISLDCRDLSEIYIDVTQDNEGVNFIAII